MLSNKVQTGLFIKGQLLAHAVLRLEGGGRGAPAVACRDPSEHLRCISASSSRGSAGGAQRTGRRPGTQGSPPPPPRRSRSPACVPSPPPGSCPLPSATLRGSPCAAVRSRQGCVWEATGGTGRGHTHDDPWKQPDSEATEHTALSTQNAQKREMHRDGKKMSGGQNSGLGGWKGL